MVMRRVWLFLSCALFLAVAATSAPMWGDRMDLVQPDGSKVPVLVWGDEYYQRIESLDSFTLVRDSATGWICYAKVSDDAGTYLSTGVRYAGPGSNGTVAARSTGAIPHLTISDDAIQAAHDRTKALLEPPGPRPSQPEPPRLGGGMAARAAGSTRTVVSLTALVDFSDAPATITRQEIDDLFNKTGYTGFGNNGSVHDFYADVSSGHLQMSSIVVSYLRASKPKSYYNNPGLPSGVRAQELVAEVLSALDTRGFDFTQLSADGSKNVFAVNVLYAGNPDVGWAKGLWPHKGNVSGVVHDGMNIGVYELSNIGTSPQIGVLCHENGHMVMGWPDLYDYSYKSQGTGQYDLMSAGTATNPQPPDPWLRDMAGWDATTRLESVTTGTVLKHVANSGTNFRYDNPLNAREHYYVESRRAKGRNTNLPDEGLLVWHVDENGSNNNYKNTAASHYLVALVQADGLLQLEKGKKTGAGDLFRAGYKDVFGSTTTPKATWWNGSVSGFRIGAIGPVADTMSFVWNGGTDLPWLPAETPSGATAGLHALYAEGTWTEVPSFPQTVFKKKTTVKTLSATIPGVSRAQNYAISYDGYFSAPVEGKYTFKATSDLAMRVWIGKALVADLTSAHAGETTTFSVVMPKGYHSLRVSYLHGTSTANLGLTVSGPGIAETQVGSPYIFRDGSLTYANDPVFPSNANEGLRYKYYEGSWTKLPTFSSLTPVRTGSVGGLKIDSVGTKKSSDYGIVFEGNMKIDTAGTYTIYLASADGSRLTLDGTALITNNGLHAAKEASASKRLYPGLHTLKVEFFQHSHSPALTVSYKIAGGTKKAIPDSRFSIDTNQVFAAGQSEAFGPDEDGSFPDPSPTVDAVDLGIKASGRTVTIQLPQDYIGPVKADLFDPTGRLLASTSVLAGPGASTVSLQREGLSGMALVRVQMGSRVEGRLVPISR